MILSREGVLRRMAKLYNQTMHKKSQILLYIIAVYMGGFGLLYLLMPNTAAELTKSTPAPTLSLLYGQYAVTFALVALLAAREKQRSSKLPLVILILLTGHVLIFGYVLLAGIWDFAQAGPPLIVNAILAILLFLFQRRAG